jgi:hypothetical protein
MTSCLLTSLEHRPFFLFLILCSRFACVISSIHVTSLHHLLIVELQLGPRKNKSRPLRNSSFIVPPFSDRRDTESLSTKSTSTTPLPWNGWRCFLIRSSEVRVSSLVAEKSLAGWPRVSKHCAWYLAGSLGMGYGSGRKTNTDFLLLSHGDKPDQRWETQPESAHYCRQKAFTHLVCVQLSAAGIRGTKSIANTYCHVSDVTYTRIWCFYSTRSAPGGEDFQV